MSNSQKKEKKENTKKLGHRGVRFLQEKKSVTECEV